MNDEVAFGVLHEDFRSITDEQSGAGSASIIEEQHAAATSVEQHPNDGETREFEDIDVDESILECHETLAGAQFDQDGMLCVHS